MDMQFFILVPCFVPEQNVNFLSVKKESINDSKLFTLESCLLAIIILKSIIEKEMK